MTEQKVRRLMLGILGGLGLLYLVIAALLGILAYTLTPEQVIAMEGDPEAMPVMSAVFGVLGLAFAGAGAGTYLGMKRSARQREELFLYGQVVNGVVEKVTCNHAVRVNRHSPWRAHVQCRHPLTRENVTVRSHAVFDMTVQPGDSVRVAFDPLDEKKHAVELPERKTGT